MTTAQEGHPPMSEPATTRRRSKGFRPAAAVLAKDIRRGAEGRGFSVTTLLTSWAEVAGDLAAMTRPIKVSYGRGGMGGTLVVLTTGPHAPLVEMQLPVLRQRVNACYGYNAIARITLTQTAPTGFAEGQAQFTHAPRRPAPSPEDTARARDLAQKFDNPDLAAAMARLAESHFARRTRAPYRKETT